MTVPVAVVGMDFREGPSHVRALLKSIDDAPDSPSHRLRENGEAAGIVRIESCSRIEWVVSGTNPAWAANLLRGALLSRLGSHALGRVMHAKVSRGAVHYLVRVALGLESVAEGEHAIGRQVIKAFEAAHGHGRTDRTLHVVWHALGRLLQVRKDAGHASSVGVQSLVVNECKSLPRDRPVPVFGIGDIGRQVLNALARDGLTANGFGRAHHAEFAHAAQHAHGAVICTGGHAAHVALPERADSPLAVDVGSPAQLLRAPGWRTIGLDELLSRRGLTLNNDDLAALQTLADDAAQALEESLDDTAQHHVLEALESERKKFFEDDIEALVAQLPPREARRITAQLRGFTHRLLEATRRAGRAQ